MNRETIINRPLDVFRKAMLFLLLCVLIASCSKEDAITEETGITGTEGKQYILTWKGGLSTGRKTGGVLKTVIRGEQTKNTDLDLLEIKESGNSTYEIFLRGGGRKGEIVFTK